MNSTTKFHLEPVDFDPFRGPEIEQIVPLSKPQEEIWLSCKLGGEDASRAYNESVSIQLKGDLDQQALEKALEDLILRHQSLRSNFSSSGTEIIIYKNKLLNLVYKNLSNQKATEQQSYFQQFLQDDAHQDYDLENDLLFRTACFKLSPQKHYFVFSTHHIVCDGWSIGILLQNLSKLYSAYQQHQQPNLPQVPQMSQYILEQLQFAQSEAYQQSRQFWIDQFKGKLPITELPLTYPRPANRTYQSRREDFKLKPELTAALKKTGAKKGCSFVVTLLSAFEVLLHQITHQQEIVVGLPAAGQAAAGYNGLTGHCVNLLPKKSMLKEASTFNTFLAAGKTAVLDILEHQQFSLGSLLQNLTVTRDASRVPLVPVVFNAELNMDEDITFNGLTHRLYYPPRAFETFEIFLNVSGSERDLTLEWSYNTQLFNAETIGRMMKSFEELLQVLIQEPDRKISSIKLLADDHPRNIEPGSPAITAYPKVSLPEMISRSLKKHAVKTAISFYQESISNAGLLSKSNQMASLLLKRGIQKGDLVAVALDRSIEMVITLLAILKTGAAYVPIDPTYPAERIRYLLQDSGAKLLVVNQKYQGNFLGNHQELVLEESIQQLNSYLETDPEIVISGQDLAYVLYTSGSTGLPKGVEVEHHNVVNLLHSIQQWPGISADDKMLAIATISFDITGLELFLPLIIGAEIILADTKTAKNGFELLKLIQTSGITLIQGTPSTFQMLLEVGWKDKIATRILCCGDALPQSLAKKLLTLCKGLWNMYGPTETTIYSTGTEIKNADTLITIGKPISNTQIYILDEHLNLVPEGETGEIFIAGEGVARGYLNRPELTAARFFEDQFSKITGQKMYRSGDLGRVLQNGEIEYLGRTDHQIKIRGHRIQPGEIEYQLLQQENVRQALVMAREDQPGNVQLVAYIAASAANENEEKQWIDTWKTALKEALPLYMLPAHIVILASFPLTPNHKIDRNALPKPPAFSANQTHSFIGPRTDVEKLVSDIWVEVLGLKNISIYDNFFEIGGHSLLAVQIMQRIEKETGKRLPLATLFESSTIESLSLLLQVDEKADTWNSLVSIRPKGNKTPLYMVHGAGLNVLLFNNLSKYLDAEQPVYGLQAKGLNGLDAPLDKLEDIASHYINQILKHNPNGPYALAGYSLGGTIAYEMAKQLQALDKEVKVLALFDSYASQTELSYSKSVRLIRKIWDYTCRFFYTFLLLTRNPISTLNYKIQSTKRKLTSIYVKINPAKHKGEASYLQEIDKLNQKAAAEYFITPYNGTVDLFKAKVRTYYMPDPEYLGWKKYALKGVRTHEIPGDHNYIFAPPNDKEFAQVLQRCLNQSA